MSYDHGSFAQSLRASQPRRPGAGRPRLFGENRQVSASLRYSEVFRFREFDHARGSPAQGVRLALAHYLPYAWLFDPPPPLEPSQVNAADPAIDPTSLWLPDVDIETVREMGDRNVTKGLRVLLNRLRYLPAPPKLTPRDAQQRLKQMLAVLVDQANPDDDPLKGLSAAERAAIDADYEKATAEVEASIEAGIRESST